MRFHTEITASRKSAPIVDLVMFPSGDKEPEIKIWFGGLGVWLSVSEADDLAAGLIKAAGRIRQNAAPEES